MRDYLNFDRYVDRLSQDIYNQPPDPGHTAWAYHSLEWIRTTIYADMKDDEISGSVLDVGCGWGYLAKNFEEMIGLDWTGITIGSDVAGARLLLEEFGLSVDKVIDADMTFLPWDSPEFDLIYARHVLEHSPFPIITLMEWHRVTKEGGYLCLIAPAPHYWKYRGRNHYSIVPAPLLKWWLERAGWKIEHEFEFTSRDPLFLKHLEVYQQAIKFTRAGTTVIKGGPADALKPYPPGPVEYRFICKKATEVWE